MLYSKRAQVLPTDIRILYTSSSNTYCLTGTNNNIAYIATTTSPTPAVGVYPGHTPPTANVAVTTLAGLGAAGFADGTGTGAQFSVPCSVAVDASDTIYVADANNQRIRKLQ